MAFKYGDVLKVYEGVEQSGDIMKWLGKVEMVMELQQVEKKETFMPMFLAGQALEVYLQLSQEQKADYERLVGALQAAFSPSPFSAYEELQQRHYRQGEAVDAYLADIKRLLALAGGFKDPPDMLVKSSFVTGLPQDVKKQLLAMSDAGELSVGELVVRARAVLSASESGVACAGVGRDRAKGVSCYRCGRLGHYARQCTSRAAAPRMANVSKAPQRCFLCQQLGHVARLCPQRSGNEAGEVSLVQEASPKQ